MTQALILKWGLGGWARDWTKVGPGGVVRMVLDHGFGLFVCLFRLKVHLVVDNKNTRTIFVFSET